MTNDLLLDTFAKTLREKNIDSQETRAILLGNPLYFDFTLEEGAVKPWEHPQEWVPLLFQTWEERKKQLLPVFQTRKSRCSQDEMLTGVCCFIASLYWTMGKPVTTLAWKTLIQENFPAKPINWAERLEFILLKPTQYHCFIQLDELFTEMKKQFYKYAVMNKL
ncbi:hypothetical protein HOO54_11475 [Bacillus sp. WMMC1349]|uniref:YpoC family protein n=1 Tax=Bacillus sp. WMMC1349 TaxID=2736254 RepID=UPI0015546381|nr:hypothetical protein [Bacillus sp. WMMC1349]NPC92834.1 hypothetical protein [Bacillus sp. WMMC1349]